MLAVRGWPTSQCEGQPTGLQPRNYPRRTRLDLSTHKEGQTMKTKYTVALSMIAGALLGATAIQGLHAQVKKVYFISESEVVDRAAVPAWNTAVQKAIKDAGG